MKHIVVVAFTILAVVGAYRSYRPPPVSPQLSKISERDDESSRSVFLHKRDSSANTNISSVDGALEYNFDFMQSFAKARYDEKRSLGNPLLRLSLPAQKSHNNQPQTVSRQFKGQALTATGLRSNVGQSDSDKISVFEDEVYHDAVSELPRTRVLQKLFTKKYQPEPDLVEPKLSEVSAVVYNAREFLQATSPQVFLRNRAMFRLSAYTYILLVKIDGILLRHVLGKWLVVAKSADQLPSVLFQRHVCSVGMTQKRLSEFTNGYSEATTGLVTSYEAIQDMSKFACGGYKLDDVIHDARRRRTQAYAIRDDNTHIPLTNIIPSKYTGLAM